MTKDNTKGPGGPGKRGQPSQRSDAFERKTFRTSRLADFASIPELIKQTGQPPEHWPLVIPELADNGVDERGRGRNRAGDRERRHRQFDQGPQQDRLTAVSEIPSKCWRKCCWQIRAEIGSRRQVTLAAPPSAPPRG
jgi:hypothetical protein